MTRGRGALVAGAIAAIAMWFPGCGLLGSEEGVVITNETRHTVVIHYQPPEGAEAVAPLRPVPPGDSLATHESCSEFFPLIARSEDGQLIERWDPQPCDEDWVIDGRDG